MKQVWMSAVLLGASFAYAPASVADVQIEQDFQNALISKCVGAGKLPRPACECQVDVISQLTTPELKSGYLNEDNSDFMMGIMMQKEYLLDACRGADNDKNMTQAKWDISTTSVAQQEIERMGNAVVLSKAKYDLTPWKSLTIDVPSNWEIKEVKLTEQGLEVVNQQRRYVITPQYLEVMAIRSQQLFAMNETGDDKKLQNYWDTYAQRYQ